MCIPRVGFEGCLAFDDDLLKISGVDGGQEEDALISGKGQGEEMNEIFLSGLRSWRWMNVWYFHTGGSIL